MLRGDAQHDCGRAAIPADNAEMISIVPYNPEWPSRFDRLAKPVRMALGDLAIRIDHIGSTAIPGLAAKDLIDIQITAVSLDPAIEAALGRAGFTRREHITNDHIPPGGPDDLAEWTKWFFRPIATEVAVNLHVRLLGRANQRYPILFRDYLRNHPTVAEAYGQVKTALVAHRMDDLDAYYDVKDPVCDIIMFSAETWAASTGWTQGPSDA